MNHLHWILVAFDPSVCYLSGPSSPPCTSTKLGPGWGELAVPIITEHPATAIIFVGSQLTIVLLGRSWQWWIGLWEISWGLNGIDVYWNELGFIGN